VPICVVSDICQSKVQRQGSIPAIMDFVFRRQVTMPPIMRSIFWLRDEEPDALKMLQMFSSFVCFSTQHSLESGRRSVRSSPRAFVKHDSYVHRPVTRIALVNNIQSCATTGRRPNALCAAHDMTAEEKTGFLQLILQLWRQAIKFRERVSLIEEF
jgi:hypothetical protein